MTREVHSQYPNLEDAWWNRPDITIPGTGTTAVVQSTEQRKPQSTPGERSRRPSRQRTQA